MEFRRFDWKRAQIASSTFSRPEEKHGVIETTIEEGSKRIPGHLVERRPLRPLHAGRPLEGAPRGISSFRSETSSNRVHRPFDTRKKAWCDRNDHRGCSEMTTRPSGESTSFACRSSFVTGGNEIVGSCGRWSSSTHVEVSLPSKSWPTEVSR